MGQVVLLVVGAAWVAVLIPPLLRSRGQNRPNSSVSDFRDQLSSLQRVSGGVRMRAMGRSLVAGPVERPAPRGSLEGSHRSITLHPATGKTDTGAHAIQPPTRRRDPLPRGHMPEPAARRHEQGRGERSHRQLAVRRDGPDAVKRRRANVLFVLALAAVTTLVLAGTTKSTPLLYVSLGVFVVLAGYVYLLGRARQRETVVGDIREFVDVTPAPGELARQHEPSRRRPRQAVTRQAAPRRQDPSLRGAAPTTRRAVNGRQYAGAEPMPRPRERPMRQHRLDLA